jgi:APA family basic amino acid/polyamine antiporter
MTPSEQVIAPPPPRRVAQRPPDSGDGLVRGLTLPMATAIVVGTMIGTGIFIKPAEIARLAGSVEWALAAWVAGGVLTLLAALCYMELGTMMPAAGADYAYLKRAWNPGVGFVFGWKQFVVTHPASMASLASGSALFASYIWPGLRTPVAELGSLTIEAGNLFAAALIVAVTLINLLDVASVGRFQVVLTGLKVVSLLVVVGVGLWFAGKAAPDLSAASTRAVSATGFAAAVGASLWTFSGWHTMLRVGSEIQQPERTIPRAMLAGFGATAVLFLLINVACFQVLGFDAVAASPHVTSDLLQLTIGVAGAGLLSLMMLLSAVGSLNSTTLGTARISYAMARDRLLPEFLARLHPERRVPTWSVIAPSVVAIAFVLTGTFEDLTSLFVFTQWLFYALGIWGLMRLRRLEPDTPRPVRVPFYPVLPVLVIVLSLALTAVQFMDRPLRSSIGLALVLLGWPVYLWMRGRAAQSLHRP